MAAAKADDRLKDKISKLAVEDDQLVLGAGKRYFESLDMRYLQPIRLPDRTFAQEAHVKSHDEIDPDTNPYQWILTTIV